MLGRTRARAESFLTKMESDDEYTIEKLEKCTYRQLQCKAKLMALPSNVKKIYLVQLIRTKVHGSQSEVDLIINKVKRERMKLSFKKRNRPKRRTGLLATRSRLQGSEISSTSDYSKSPPITCTPKHPLPIIVRCNSSIANNLMKYNHRPFIYRNTTISTTSARESAKSSESSPEVINHTPIKTYSLRTDNDRVLRNRRYLMSPANEKNNAESLKQIPKKEVEESNVFQPLSEAKKNIVTYSSSLVDPKVFDKNSIINRQTSLTIIRKNYNTNVESQLPAKCCRALSGIYPIATNTNPQNCSKNQYVQTDLGIRNRDGTYLKINALVQKKNSILQTTTASNIQSPNKFNSIISTNKISNLATTTKHTESGRNVLVETIKHESENYQSYCHKKIRAELFTSKKEAFKKNDENVPDNLPRIHEVFSNFNHINNSTNDYTQPLSINISDEPQRYPNTTNCALNIQKDCMLEMIYNFKKHLLTNSPFLEMKTTTNTYCVYSTPVCVTSMPFVSSTTMCNNQYISSHRETGYQNYDNCNYPRFEDVISMKEQMVYDNSYISSPDSNQLNSDMEDALELISQDGDYMERIGMDVRMPCLFCDWAGPKMMLEHHIRKDHAEKIHRFTNQEWNITFTLGSLIRKKMWVSETIDNSNGGIYVVSAHCCDSWFMASLAHLSTDLDTPRAGTITVYNKVTGKPYSWTGIIPSLPTSLPMNNDLNEILKVKLSKLDLLPNSANLVLEHDQLVINNSTKVICGQPELDNIHIILFVKI